MMSYSPVFLSLIRMRNRRIRRQMRILRSVFKLHYLRHRDQCVIVNEVFAVFGDNIMPMEYVFFLSFFQYYID